MVAGAVVHAVAGDEFEVLDDEVAPRVVDEGFGGDDVHAGGEERAPGGDAGGALRGVVGDERDGGGERFGREGEGGAPRGGEFRGGALAFPFPRGVEHGEEFALFVGEFAVGERDRRAVVEGDGDGAGGALREVEFDERDAVRGEGRIGAGEGLETVDLGGTLRARLRERDGALGLDRGSVAVADFGDGQPTLGERGLAGAVAEGAEHQFVGADAESEGGAVVVPAARAAAEVDAAAVGNEAGFDGRVRRAEDDGVVAEVGVDVAGRWQERGEEGVAGAVGLGHRGFAPEVEFGGEGGFERRKGGGRCGGEGLTGPKANEEKGNAGELCERGGEHGARNFPGGQKSRARRSGRSGGTWRRRA